MVTAIPPATSRQDARHSPAPSACIHRNAGHSHYSRGRISREPVMFQVGWLRLLRSLALRREGFLCGEPGVAVGDDLSAIEDGPLGPFGEITAADHLRDGRDVDAEDLRRFAHSDPVRHGTHGSHGRTALHPPIHKMHRRKSADRGGEALGLVDTIVKTRPSGPEAREVLTGQAGCTRLDKADGSRPGSELGGQFSKRRDTGYPSQASSDDDDRHNQVCDRPDQWVFAVGLQPRRVSSRVTNCSSASSISLAKARLKVREGLPPGSVSERGRLNVRTTTGRPTRRPSRRVLSGMVRGAVSLPVALGRRGGSIPEVPRT